MSACRSFRPLVTTFVHHLLKNCQVWLCLFIAWLFLAKMILLLVFVFFVPNGYGCSYVFPKSFIFSYMCIVNPAKIYSFKVNNRNTRKRCEMCSKLTIKTPERRQWLRSGVFIVNFEHISHLFLLSLLWNLNK